MSLAAPWASGVPGAGQGAHGCVPTATDLLEKILELDVDKRLTAAQALAHPFFEPFRDPEEETEASQPFDDSLEHKKLTVDEWKRKSRAAPAASLLLLLPLPAWPPLGDSCPFSQSWLSLLGDPGLDQFPVAR